MRHGWHYSPCQTGLRTGPLAGVAAVAGAVGVAVPAVARTLDGLPNPRWAVLTVLAGLITFILVCAARGPYVRVAATGDKGVEQPQPSPTVPEQPADPTDPVEPIGSAAEVTVLRPHLVEVEAAREAS